ncbi:MAG TPA: recombinase family protein, partial [Ktedonobacterales bacterium]
MLIGYTRISTHEQTLNLQKDALNIAGCEQIYTDTVSGAKAERPGLTQAISHLRSGDTLVVWKLDRLGRSLKHLIETVSSLQEQ